MRILTCLGQQGVRLWNLNYDGSVRGGRSDSDPLTDEWLSRLQSHLDIDDDQRSGGFGVAGSDGSGLSFSSAYAESNRRDSMAAAASSSSHSQLESAEAAPPASFEPEFTNYTESFKGCIDYLLYSNHPRLTLVDILPVLKTSDMLAAQCVGIPSVKPEEPSDHLPLAATFNLKI
jgi:hypothetical protein